MSAKKPWGQHLILDLAGCNENIRKEAAIRAFVKELIAAIDMVAYGEPVIEHFAEQLQDAAGYSLVQLIETSAVTGHFSDNNGDAYLDVFSCKPFDIHTAIAVTRKHFEPESMHMVNLARDAKHPPEEPFIALR